MSGMSSTGENMPPGMNMRAHWGYLANWVAFCIPIIMDDHFMMAILLPQSATIKVVDSRSAQGAEGRATVTSALQK